MRNKRIAQRPASGSPALLPANHDPDATTRPGITPIPSTLRDKVVWRPIGDLRSFPLNPRAHPDKQIAMLCRSIAQFGFVNPVLTDEGGTILAGHGRVQAARRLGMAKVPTLMLAGLQESEKKALVIADNRTPEQAIWDIELLKTNFTALIDVDFDVELTGFTAGEVDLMLDGPKPDEGDRDDDHGEAVRDGAAVSRLGDVWQIGRHRIVCGDARAKATYRELLGAEVSQMVFTDPPYNVPIAGHVMGRGSVRHREFVMAAGEMSPAAFTRFLTEAMQLAVSASANGSIHYWCMDWRHLAELNAAATASRLEPKNLIVWVKSNAGQGSFYRNGHELIAVFKSGTAKHINNFGLGGQGRYRTNVWAYPSVNSQHPARRGDLDMHPTVKPVALVADAMRDCSKRNGVILDPFGGSGTTILAAERTGRVARLIELDPLYVDQTIRRWEQSGGAAAVHVQTGRSFAERRAELSANAQASEAQATQGDVVGRKRRG